MFAEHSTGCRALELGLQLCLLTTSPTLRELTAYPLTHLIIQRFRWLKADWKQYVGQRSLDLSSLLQLNLGHSVDSLLAISQRMQSNEVVCSITPACIPYKMRTPHLTRERIRCLAFTPICKKSCVYVCMDGCMYLSISNAWQ
jgi:hypothetical protein